MEERPSRAGRRDAAANRERLLDIAEEFFAEEGLDASLNRLAAKAGLGVATLYRHFPTRDDLIRAVFDRQSARMTALLEHCAQIDDGWQALVTAIDGSVAIRFASPSAREVSIRMARIDPDYGPALRWHPIILDMVARAHTQGSLRADVTAMDIAHIPVLLSSLVWMPEPVRGVIVARQRAILLDGLRPDGEKSPLPDAAPAPHVLHALVQGRFDDAVAG
jgi:AcrR family transcriptional regulator